MKDMKMIGNNYKNGKLNVNVTIIGLIFIFGICIDKSKCRATILEPTNNINCLEETFILKIADTQLYKYKSYKDVSILNFFIPPDVTSATFSFRVRDEEKGFSGHCDAQNITIVLKPRSFPIIHLKDNFVSQNFLKQSQRLKDYTFNFISGHSVHNITVEHPIIGNWYAAAFIEGSIEDKEKILPKGIVAECKTLLSAELYTTKDNIPTLEPSHVYKHTLNYLSKDSTTYDKATKKLQGCEHLKFQNTKVHSVSYKLFVPQNTDTLKLSYTIFESCDNCPSILLSFQNIISSSTANFENYSNISSTCEIKPLILSDSFCEFDVEPSSWNYLYIKYADTEICTNQDNKNISLIIESTLLLSIEFSMSNFSIIINETASWSNYYFSSKYYEKKQEQIKFVSLLKETYNSFFMFALNLIKAPNSSDHPLLQISQGFPVGFLFEVEDVKDIGGTLTIGISMNQKLTKNNFKTLFSPSIENLEKEEEENALYKHIELSDLFDPIEEEALSRNQTLIICLKFSVVGIPIWPDKCRYDNEIMNATAIIKDTMHNIPGKILHIPFPESGVWSLTIGLFCSRSDNLLLNPKKQQQNCNANLLVSVVSNPCIMRRCGKFGRCFYYRSGGFVYSTCVCIKGYSGWDCSESVDGESNFTILTASLGLVISNLFFLFSIYMSIKRNYLSESIIFASTMLFSGFYHACDAGEEIYSYCIVKKEALQYCDFYCGLFSIWVTLIAIAHLKANLVPHFHIAGAILIAFETTLDKESIWVFIVPTLFGALVIALNWGHHWKKNKSLLPSKKYLKFHLPIGLGLSVTGIICFAFLQTKRNYHIVHSIWHVLMAFSIVCLLPIR